MRRALAVVLLCLLAAGCGGGGDDDPAPTTSPAAEGGGTEQAPVLGTGGEEEEAAADLGFPAFATRNTTRVGSADAIATAAAVALAVYPSRDADTRPRAVTLVDTADWRVAVSAAQLMAPPLGAPILFAENGALPPASEQALGRLVPSGAEEAGGAQVLRVGGAAEAAGYKTTPVEGADHTALAQAVDRLATAAAGSPSEAVVVASEEQPGYAMPAAAWAAKSGDPVLWVTRDGIPAATRAAITSHKRPRIYVLGPESAISDDVVDQLDELGNARRIDGADPVTNAIEFARFSDGSSGWNVVDPGHGLVFATTQRPLDAAAAAPLSASGTYGPLLLVTAANALPAPLQDYLLDIQPGYDKDPVRGVYNHGWIIGDESAVSVDVQARIDTLLEIQPVGGSSSGSDGGDGGDGGGGGGEAEAAAEAAAAGATEPRRGADRRLRGMAEAEKPDRLDPRHRVTVDDVRQLMGASTPHFALQLRNRIRKLIAGLAVDDPARLLGEQEIARLERLGFSGEVRGEQGSDAQQSLASVGEDELSRHVDSAAQH